MPALSIIAVYVAKLGWCQYEFGDHTRGKPFSLINTFGTLREMSNDLDVAAWIAFQQALLNQGKWITVGDVNLKSE